MKKSFKIVLVSIIFTTSFLCTFLYNRTKFLKEEQRRETILNSIKSKYNKYVKVLKETDLYELKDNTYTKAGHINENIVVELSDNEITYETKYFKLEKLNYYIDYNDVEPSEQDEINKRYKKYVVFNKNIVTNDKTSFYNEDGSLFITVNESFDLPIIINDKDKYGIEFLDRLLYVKKEDVKEEKNVTNTKEKTRTNIRTLTYHTVYQKGKEKCTNSAVCHPINLFEEQMKYLHDKGYLTLTMEELEMFLNGKIRIPKNTIVVTLDDGRKLHNSVPIVEKYEIDATFFIITGVNSVKDYLGKVKYAHFESHTDNLHHNYVCKGGYYGSELLCTSYDKLVKDFKTCIEKLGGTSHYFAYPFFDSNDTIIKALKATGYKLAFVGEVNSGGYSDAKTDKYRLRRKTIFGTDSLKVLKSYLPESE